MEGIRWACGHLKKPELRLLSQQPKANQGVTVHPSPPQRAFTLLLNSAPLETGPSECPAESQRIGFQFDLFFSRQCSRVLPAGRDVQHLHIRQRQTLAERNNQTETGDTN
jgi:hypothetical protein